MPRVTGNCAAGVRQDMLGRGFALVRTPPFFDDRLFLRLGKITTVLSPHGKRWGRSPELARYGCWLEELLARALPEEPVCLATLELRREATGARDPDVNRLHADGSYIRAVCTLYGPGTVYRDGDEEHPVRRGQTLLMTAMERARAVGVRCTLHRRPGAGPERALIVCSFEPGHAPRT
jgi:hypothetical protein